MHHSKAAPVMQQALTHTLVHASLFLAGLAVPQKFSQSLEGLRVILGVRPQIFNFVLPKVVKQPLMVSVWGG